MAGAIPAVAQNVRNSPDSALLKPEAFWKPDFVACAGVEGTAARRNRGLFERQDHSAPTLHEGPMVTSLTHMSRSLSPRTSEWSRQWIYPFLSARGGSIAPNFHILPPSLLQLTTGA